MKRSSLDEAMVHLDSVRHTLAAAEGYAQEWQPLTVGALIRIKIAGDIIGDAYRELDLLLAQVTDALANEAQVDDEALDDEVPS